MSALTSIAFSSIMTVVGVIFTINAYCDDRWDGKVDNAKK